MFVDQGVQPLFERDRSFFRRPCGRATHRCQHAGEQAALHVVERIRLIATGMHECLFVAGHAVQYPEVQQCATNRHEFTPLVLRLEREGEVERRLRGELQQSLAQQAQGDLRVGAFSTAQARQSST
jgi:hypothetical protein